MLEKKIESVFALRESFHPLRGHPSVAWLVDKTEFRGRNYGEAEGEVNQVTRDDEPEESVTRSTCSSI